MLRTDGMDVLRIKGRVYLTPECGLRPMKSLRKTTILTLLALTLVPFVSLMAQDSKPDMPAPVPGAQQPPPPDTAVPGQGRIGISVNQVIVPVTVKDGSSRLVADLSKEQFLIFQEKARD